MVFIALADEQKYADWSNYRLGRTFRRGGDASEVLVMFWSNIDPYGTFRLAGASGSIRGSSCQSAAAAAG
ncbi:hypothetical protein AMK09_07845 [Streptomyces sp. CB02488]|nr:hypothetical protein AMK09_07845 [Streptomyces sp. CB02488]